jgi:hypothetical protein
VFYLSCFAPPSILVAVNGELAQLVALVTYGTRFLRTRTGVDETFERTNSTFQFVNAIAFRFDGELVGGSVVEWLRWLESIGASRLTLDTARPGGGGRSLFHWFGPREPDRMVAGFSNSGPGLVWSHGPSSEVWRASWAFGHATDDRPWSVEYSARRAKVTRRDSVTLTRAERDLGDALREAHAVALAIGDEPWPDVFERARRLLRDGGDPPYHPDLLPPGDDQQECRRLLAAAAGAYVFGAMGSWNDIAPQERGLKRRYDRASDRLFRADLAALEVGTNAFE